MAAKQGMLAFIDKFCFLPVNFSGRLFANEPCFKLKKERIACISPILYGKWLKSNVGISSKVNSLYITIQSCGIYSLLNCFCFLRVGSLNYYRPVTDQLQFDYSSLSTFITNEMSTLLLNIIVVCLSGVKYSVLSVSLFLSLTDHEYLDMCRKAEEARQSWETAMYNCCQVYYSNFLLCHKKVGNTNFSKFFARDFKAWKQRDAYT